MKKYFTKLVTYSFFAAALLLAACESPLRPLAPANSMYAETGQVLVFVDLWAGELPSANIAANVGFDAGGFDADGLARTIYPGKVFDHYVYTFTKSGGSPEVKTPEGDVFTLAAGSWTLAVGGYATSSSDSLAATGSTASAFTVSADALTDNITVSMAPVVSEGQGTLSYSITYPATATLQTLSLMSLGVSGTTNLLTGAAINGGTTTGTKTALAAGYYLMSATLTDAGKTAGKSEVVHIGNDLTTNAAFTFAAVYFTEPPPFVAVSSISGIPNSAEMGVSLPLSGTVAPASATNQTIVWSVKSAGTTGAPISGSTLNTSAGGTVTITATIANGAAMGTAYTQDFTITVINPSDVIDLAVFTTYTAIKAKVEALVAAEDSYDGSSHIFALTVKAKNADFSGDSTQMWLLLRALNGYYVKLEILNGTGCVWPELYENLDSSTTI